MYHHPCPVCGLFQTERPSAHIVPAGGNYCLISKFSPFLPSSPGHSQILSRSCGEMAWDQNYDTDWKWWTQYKPSPRYVLTESTISGP